MDQPSVLSPAIPIASLSPSLSGYSLQSIKGVITLLWPYSSSTRSLALLLAEPDFRLRRRKGQVRVRFEGTAAKRIADEELQIGDILHLSLAGCDWVKDGQTERIETPGRSIDYELRYRNRLRLEVYRSEAFVANLDVVHDQSANSEDLNTRNPSGFTPPLYKPRDGGFEDETVLRGLRCQWAPSGLFKRARLCGDDFSEPDYGPIDGFADDHELEKRRISWRRDSNSWVFTRGPPSPPRKNGFQEVDHTQSLDSKNPRKEEDEVLIESFQKADEFAAFGPIELVEGPGLSRDDVGVNSPETNSFIPVKCSTDHTKKPTFEVDTFGQQDRGGYLSNEPKSEEETVLPIQREMAQTGDQYPTPQQYQADSVSSTIEETNDDLFRRNSLDRASEIGLPQPPWTEGWDEMPVSACQEGFKKDFMGYSDTETEGFASSALGGDEIAFHPSLLGGYFMTCQPTGKDMAGGSPTDEILPTITQTKDTENVEDSISTNIISQSEIGGGGQPILSLDNDATGLDMKETFARPPTPIIVDLISEANEEDGEATDNSSADTRIVEGSDLISTALNPLTLPRIQTIGVTPPSNSSRSAFPHGDGPATPVLYPLSSAVLPLPSPFPDQFNSSDSPYFYQHHATEVNSRQTSSAQSNQQSELHHTSSLMTEALSLPRFNTQLEQFINNSMAIEDPVQMSFQEADRASFQSDVHLIQLGSSLEQAVSDTAPALAADQVKNESNFHAWESKEITEKQLPLENHSRHGVVSGTPRFKIRSPIDYADNFKFGTKKDILESPVPVHENVQRLSITRSRTNTGEGSLPDTSLGEERSTLPAASTRILNKPHNMTHENITSDFSFSQAQNLSNSVDLLEISEDPLEPVLRSFDKDSQNEIWQGNRNFTADSTSVEVPNSLLERRQLSNSNASVTVIETSTRTTRGTGHTADHIPTDWGQKPERSRKPRKQRKSVQPTQETDAFDSNKPAERHSSDAITALTHNKLSLPGSEDAPTPKKLARQDGSPGNLLKPEASQQENGESVIVLHHEIQTRSHMLTPKSSQQDLNSDEPTSTVNLINTPAQSVSKLALMETPKNAVDSSQDHQHINAMADSTRVYSENTKYNSPTGISKGARDSKSPLSNPSDAKSLISAEVSAVQAVKPTADLQSQHILDQTSHEDSKITGLRTPLSYYHPLSLISLHFNSTTQRHDPYSSLDVIVVVLTVSAAPKRASAGRKDYKTTFSVTDRSIFPQNVLVQVFRPWKSALPEMSVGDIVLLRNMGLKAYKSPVERRRVTLVSGEDSAWCVWKFSKIAEPSSEIANSPTALKEILQEDISGPPVEVGEEERSEARKLHLWWIDRVEVDNHEDHQRTGD